jgi:hypothetical protein
VSTDDPDDAQRHATVVRLLDDPALWAPVPPDLRARVMAAATDAATADSDATDATDDDYATDPAIDPTTGAPRPGAGPRHAAGARPGRWAATGRRRPLLLAAAAAVVVVLGVAGGIRMMGDDDAPAVEVALAGTEEAPAATADVRLSDEPAGVRVVLEVSGLAPAPEGTFYEAWLVGEAGKVSAGTFHLRGDQAEIDLWLGVEVEGYDALTVTRQPVAGGSLAEGVVVLRGELPG